MKNILVLVFCLVLGLKAMAQDSLAHYSLAQIDSLLDKLQLNKQQNQMLPYAQAGAAKALQLNGKQDTIYAKMVYFLGVAHQAGQNPLESEKCFQLAIEIFEAKNAKNIYYAGALNMLGVLYRRMGQLKKSEDLSLRALATYESISGKQNVNYAGVLNNLGTLYFDLGNYEKAETYYHGALQTRKQVLGSQNIDYIGSQINLGMLYDKTEKYETAERFLLSALETLEQTQVTKHPYYVNCLNNLGLLYGHLEQYERAEIFNLRCLELKKELFGVQHPSYAASLSNLGNVYEAMGEYEKAESYFEHSLQIQKEVFGGENPDYAGALVNLGGLQELIKNYNKAAAAYQEALNIQKKILEGGHPDYAITLSNLGDLSTTQGAYKQAEVYYTEALTIYENLLGLGNVQYLRTLNNLNKMYRLSGQTDEAWACVQRAIHLNAGISPNTAIGKTWADSIANADLVSAPKMVDMLENCYYLLAQSTDAQKQQKQAIVADLALLILERSKNNFEGNEDKLRLLEQSADWVLRSLKVLDKDKQSAQAFSVAEHNKSVLLVDAVKTERAYHFGGLPDSLVQKEKQLQKQYTDINAALSDKRPNHEKDSLRAVLIGINKKIDAFKQQLKSNYPQYFALKYAHQNIAATDIQAVLDNKTALLEYVLSDSSVYIFYLDKQRVWVTENKLNRDTLRLYIKQLHNALSNYEQLATNPEWAYSNYTQLAHWFYQTLCSLLADIQGIEHLIVIPDGELAHLPFETFLVDKAPENMSSYQDLNYLIKKFKISYNYSAMLWRENLQQQKRNNNGQMFAMAAHYATASESKSDYASSYQQMRALLSPLPAARQEVELLSQHFDGYFAFDSLANERAFKQNAHQYGIIHLAMHGLLNRKTPILSALVFTENGDSTENNFLQAYEISKMALNADLVVLSACETGYGKFEKGNGTASLARAFMYAGVPALVVSLWEVNDASTSQIMQFFYQNLSNGQDKAEALRQAKLQYLSQTKGFTAHPAYWSAFVQMGNSNSIKVATKGAGNWWWWLVGGGGAALALILGYRAFSRC